MLGMKRSIFRRLLFSYLFTVLFGIASVGILISFLTKGYIYEDSQEELLRKARIVNLAIQDDETISEASERLLSFLDESFNTRIWVFNRQGEIIATSTKDEVYIGKSVAKSIVEKTLKGEDAVQRLKFEGLTEPMISVVVPWGKESNVYGGIVLHAPVTGVNKIIAKIRETILWATILGILFSTAMVSYLSWSISRPLRKIDQVTSKISMGNYDERIQIDSQDELGDLADTVNTLAEKLAKTVEERERIEQIRKDFLANVSHELKTPLSAMRGFLEALQDGLITEEGREKYYAVMYTETLHMNRLVEDIMQLIKLENKDITLTKHPIPVKPLIEKVLFKCKQQATDKNLLFHVQVPEGLPKVEADPDRLEQIISNIVHNAIKFTEEGHISIKVEQEGDFLLFTFTDTGIGISEFDQELIFERFFKVDRGRSSKDKGTGLGLAIVKELVELHQGKIAVNSELGKGTTFKVWLPVSSR